MIKLKNMLYAMPDYPSGYGLASDKVPEVGDKIFVSRERRWDAAHVIPYREYAPEEHFRYHEEDSERYGFPRGDIAFRFGDGEVSSRTVLKYQFKVNEEMWKESTKDNKYLRWEECHECVGYWHDSGNPYVLVRKEESNE